MIDQGDFLNTLGIKERFMALSKNMEKEKIALHLSSLKRLIDYNQMGKLFKVIGIRNKNSLPLVGLENIMKPYLTSNVIENFKHGFFKRTGGVSD